MEDFIPKQASAPLLPFVTRPLASNDLTLFASESDGFTAYIHCRVLEAISRAAKRAYPYETIGLLAGRILRDEKGDYALVIATEGVREGEVEATHSHVQMSASGQAQVRRRLENSAYGLDIVGWYHSHPAFPARFSGVDMTTQAAWDDPNHIGIVFSGLNRGETFGVYRGSGSVLLAPQQMLSSVPFEGHKAARQEEEVAPMTVAVRSSGEVVPGDDQTVARPAYVPAVLKPSGFGRVVPWVLLLALITTIASVDWLSRRLSNVESRIEDLAGTGDSNRAVEAQPHPALSPSSTRRAVGADSQGGVPLPEQQTPEDFSPVRANPKLPPPAASASDVPSRKRRKVAPEKAPGKNAGRRGAGANRKSAKAEKTASRANSGERSAPTSLPEAQTTPSLRAKP
jgi:proteasome lid subunit RPN8/RPN11